MVEDVLGYILEYKRFGYKLFETYIFSEDKTSFKCVLWSCALALNLEAEATGVGDKTR